MATVLTYGTYDLIHEGHLRLLYRARSLGDHLIVGLSTDEFNSVKQKVSFMNYEQRRAILEAIRYVDKVIPEHSWGQKSQDIITHNADILVMGDDWRGKFDHLGELCKVVYLSRTAGISSTILKSRFKQLGHTLDR